MARVSQAAVFVILLVVFVDTLQIALLLPLMPKIVESLGGGPSAIGALGSVAALAEGLSAPWLGALADRRGRRPVLLVAMGGCCVSCVITGFTQTYYLLLFARLTSGVCGGTGGVACAYLADVTDVNERARYMNLFEVAIFTGLTFGPALGGLLDHAMGFRWTCFCAAAICAANLAGMLLFLPESKEIDAAEPLQGTQPAASVPAPASLFARLCPCAGLPVGAFRLGAGAFLINIGFMAFDTIGVVYIQDTFFEGDPDRATLFWTKVFSACGVVGLFTSLVLYNRLREHLQKNRDPAKAMRTLIFMGGICSVCGFFAIGVPAHKLWLAIWTQVIVLGETIINPSLRTTVTFIVDERDYGKAFGMMGSVCNVSKALGPLIFAPVYEFVSHSLPWYLNSVIKAVGILFVLSAKKRDETTTNEVKPQAQQLATELPSVDGVR